MNTQSLQLLEAANRVTDEDLDILERLVEGARQKDIREDKDLTPAQVTNSIERLREGFKLPQDVRTWKAVKDKVFNNVEQIQGLMVEAHKLEGEAIHKMTRFDF